ncbi:PH domain-containing protein [Arthrobacter sp. H14-L1]|uniref:PH domain-containing protein n=1 Tax=Arthrobacter sp. H14-L1 TaxID=2996697 RepID=UPI0022703475|nr:PH domain-containing protein [Arthrobacter sp. H14-L1]MCY0905658.1 PH domain-containing protein [Arthrobacter sp. H14-L1]
MRSWLAPGEQVIVQSRPQARALTGPAVAFILIPAAGGFALAWLSHGGLARLPSQTAAWQEPLAIAVVVLGIAALVLYPLRRFLRWAGTRYTLTSRRMVVRRGWLHRERQDIALASVRNLGTRQSALQRILRSGNITLDMGFDGSAAISDIPEVARFRDLVLDAINELPHTALMGPEDDWNYAQDA